MAVSCCTCLGWVRRPKDRSCSSCLKSLTLCCSQASGCSTILIKAEPHIMPGCQPFHYHSTDTGGPCGTWFCSDLCSRADYLETQQPAGEIAMSRRKCTVELSSKPDLYISKQIITTDLFPQMNLVSTGRVHHLWLCTPFSLQLPVTQGYRSWWPHMEAQEHISQFSLASEGDNFHYLTTHFSGGMLPLPPSSGLCLHLLP